MKPNFSRISDFTGQLIILEGADGSGKSTQAKKMVKYLKNHGKIGVVVTWKDAPHFKEYFLEHANKMPGDSVSPEAHLLLQVADFLYQIEKKVIPNLLKGHTVIMDRALPTIIVRGLNVGHTIEQLEKGLLWFAHTIYRDLFDRATTLYLETTTEESLRRIWKREKKAHKDRGESTLLSLQMINNLTYLPDGEKLTVKTKKSLVEKLQSTYIASYDQYFSHHSGIKVSSEGQKKEVFQRIREALGWEK